MDVKCIVAPPISLTSSDKSQCWNKPIFGLSFEVNLITDVECFISKSQVSVLYLKPVFHSNISPHLAKNFHQEIISYFHSPLMRVVLPIQLPKIFLSIFTYNAKEHRQFRQNTDLRWLNIRYFFHIALRSSSCKMFLK